MPERRAAPRARMMKVARFRAGTRDVDCVVLDMSHSGAHVVVPPSTDLATLEDLTVALHLPTGSIVRARLRWRHDDDMGFEFLHTAGRGTERGLRLVHAT